MRIHFLNNGKNSFFLISLLVGIVVVVSFVFLWNFWRETSEEESSTSEPLVDPGLVPEPLPEPSSYKDPQEIDIPEGVSLESEIKNEDVAPNSKESEESVSVISVSDEINEKMRTEETEGLEKESQLPNDLDSKSPREIRLPPDWH